MRAAFAAALSLVIASHDAAAQAPGKTLRLGYLSSAATVFEPFRQALRELGYVEGQNLVLETRLASGRFDQLAPLAADLVRARVDMIAAVSPPAIRAAKEATATIPVVMAFSGVDPVEAGFVTSFSRPGGNVTGVAMIADEIAGKRLAVLKDALPSATRMAVLAQTDHPAAASQLKAAQEAAAKLGIELHVVRARDTRDYEGVLASVTSRAPGLLILSSPTFFEDRRQLAETAIKNRLPILCEWREMAEAGCLLAYGPNIIELYRRAAVYVDRIAKGTPPAELPVERPTKFELVVNLKTAKALGIKIPQSFLVSADRVIE
jgi:putative ABC transport system substrate-binding protein